MSGLNGKAPAPKIPILLFADSVLGIQPYDLLTHFSRFPRRHRRQRKPNRLEVRYRITWDRADQGSVGNVVRVVLNDVCKVDDFAHDAERLTTPQRLQPRMTVPVDAEVRSEEAIRLWIASRKTEMPEGTIPR
jgi:hypothetical protein